MGAEFREGNDPKGNVIKSSASQARGTSYLPGWSWGGTSSAGGPGTAEKWAAFSGWGQFGTAIKTGSQGVQAFLNDPRPPNQIPQ